MVSTRSAKKVKRAFPPSQSPTRPPQRLTRSSVRNSMSVSEEASQSPLAASNSNRRRGGGIRNVGWFVSSEEVDEEGEKQHAGELENEGASARINWGRFDGLTSAERTGEGTRVASETDAATSMFGQRTIEDLEQAGVGHLTITPILKSEGDEERFEDAASNIGEVPSEEDDVPRRIKKEPLSDDSSDEGEEVKSVALDDLEEALSHVEDKVGEDGSEDVRTSSEDSPDSDQSIITVLSPDMQRRRRLQDIVHDHADDENEDEVGRQSHSRKQSKDPTPDQESDVVHIPKEYTDPDQEESEGRFLSREQVDDVSQQRKNHDKGRYHGRKPDDDITQPNHLRDRWFHTSRVLSPIPGSSSSTPQHSSKGKNRATSSQLEAANPLSQPRQKRRNDSTSPSHISHQEQQWQEQDDENDSTSDPAESLVICRVKHQSALEEIERLKKDVEVANKSSRTANERLKMEMVESQIANAELADLQQIHKMMVHELESAIGELESLEKENKNLRDANERFSSHPGKSGVPQKGARADAQEDPCQLRTVKSNSSLLGRRKAAGTDDTCRAEKEKIRALEKELEAEQQKMRKLKDDVISILQQHVF